MIVLVPALIGLVTRLVRRWRNRGGATPATQTSEA
jgi:hypothetical protein